MSYVYVCLGALIGASARHFIFTLMAAKSLNFPYHTLVVNIIGCLLVGFIAETFALKSHLPYNIRLFLVTGILGAFTTFSAFALDAGLLIEKNEWLKSALYMASSVILGVISYFMAVYITRLVLTPKF